MLKNNKQERQKFKRKPKESRFNALIERNIVRESLIDFRMNIINGFNYNLSDTQLQKLDYTNLYFMKD